MMAVEHKFCFNMKVNSSWLSGVWSKTKTSFNLMSGAATMGKLFTLSLNI